MTDRSPNPVTDELRSAGPDVAVPSPTTVEGLVAAGQVAPPDAARLRTALARVPPGSIEREALKWVAREYGVPFTDLSAFQPDLSLVAEFPPRVMLTWDVFPLRRVNEHVEVAVARLFDSRGLDALRMATGDTLTPVLAPTDAIRGQIKTHLGIGADTLDALEPSSFLQVVDEDLSGEVDLEESAQDASIIRFVNQILIDAIDQRATDVHLEPFESEFRIRYRIDGVLQDAPVPPQLKRFQPAVVSRIKIISELDIAEKRLPQDGRIRLRLRNEDVDVRVSVIPMVHGEAVVLRLLRQGSSLLDLDELDLGEPELAGLRQLLGLPHGIVLVTGPTGSGKTTTLYAALREINDSERKIVTIEDPVEYQVRGINQIQVSEKTGLTFARGLRSVLRHDPDVVLIGEIRDTETARIAVQASLTGHLVFSTLHTNDAPSALTRLVDMGVEPYLVASSVSGVLAQRLVRTLCTECKRPLTPVDARELPVHARPAPGETFFHPDGCPQCRQTGYAGRHAICELLPMDDRIRLMVTGSASAVEIRQAARETGWRPLFQDGWRLVRAGITSPREVLRVSRDATSDLDAPVMAPSEGGL